MKRALWVTAISLGLAALSRPALAMPPETLVAHIPFAFTVGNATLPAGEYRIQQVGDLDPDLLEVRSVDGHHAAIVFCEDARAEPRTRNPVLVFDRYGQAKFLHAIELPSEPGAVFGASRSEVEAARALAAKQAAHPSTGKVSG